jgi:hypothetical protein
MRTAYIAITEAQGRQFLATVKTTYPDPTITVSLGASCTRDADPSPTDAQVRSFLLRCPNGLGGATLAVDGLGPIHTEAVVRIETRDGAATNRILTPERSTWTIPHATSWFEVGLEYVRLGALHIVSGVDHLLFLLALVLCVRRPRAVVLTETAFTLSHSISFSLTTLGVLRVSSVTAETWIALSLVFVALEIGRRDPEQPAAQTRAIVLALVFGLVHGLGFAGGLSEIGLPENGVASALVGFGVGVEIGQLLFLIVIMLALEAARRWANAAYRRAPIVGAYVVGILGAYLFWQRVSQGS